MSAVLLADFASVAVVVMLWHLNNDILSRTGTSVALVILLDLGPSCLQILQVFID